MRRFALRHGQAGVAVPGNTRTPCPRWPGIQRTEVWRRFTAVGHQAAAVELCEPNEEGLEPGPGAWRQRDSRARAPHLESAATASSLEMDRRRTTAIVAHPHASKTTLTEKFLMHGRALPLAGTLTARRNQRATASDGMVWERQRGNSLRSKVLQFDHQDDRICPLDTPGWIARRGRRWSGSTNWNRCWRSGLIRINRPLGARPRFKVVWQRRTKLARLVERTTAGAFGARVASA